MCATAENRVLLMQKQHEAHEAVLSAMRAFPLSEIVQQNACILLRNLANNGTRGSKHSVQVAVHGVQGRSSALGRGPWE